MRTVFVGSPGSLYRLKLADLPVDLDLRHSFWRFVDFSGFDLSLYNMDYMDIYDCNGQSSKPSERSNILVSRRTDWLNCTIPLSISSFNHDMMSELLRQKSGTVALARRAAVRNMRDYVDYRVSGNTVYLRSWTDTAGYLATKGIGLASGLLGANAALSAYPKLAARLKAMGTSVNWGKSAPSGFGQFEIDKTDVRTHITGFGGNDRWAIARALERLFEKRDRPRRVFIQWLDPEIILRVADITEPEDWYMVDRPVDG